MNPNSEWAPVLRFAWLTGGLVAINEPGPEVQVKAGINGKTVNAFRISTFGSLFGSLQARGFMILGATFVSDKKELYMLRRPEFRAMNPQGIWLISKLKQEWREVAFAAGKRNLMPLMDVASRIASGLQYSQMRLEDLARAYSVQLGARLHDSQPSGYQAFKDTNCFEVYKAIDALFWQMAVLRDTLAEFAARFCFSAPEVRTMRGLQKFLINNSASDPLMDEILEATNQSSGAWLAKFTAYRNCFTHVAPMEQAAGIAFAVQDMRRISDNSSVPQIYYALPENIEEIVHKRSRGIFVNSFEELTTIARRQHSRTSEPDALEYLHTCINLFGELAQVLIARSPIPPMPIHIGADDIVGKIRVTTSE